MKYTNKFIFFVLVLLILPFVSHKNSYAAITYFSDNFESGTLDKWTQNIGNVGDTSSWFISNGVLHGRVDKHGYSYLYAKVENLPQNYTLLADVVNISSVDQQFVFRVSDDKSEYYLVGFRYNDSTWYWDNNDIRVYRIYKDHYETLGVYPSVSIPRTYDITQGLSHKVRITIQDNNIKVYFDNSLAIDTNDSNAVPLNGTGVGLMTWGGDIPEISENIFSNIMIKDVISVDRNKIIILPGLGASWNPEAILLGSTASSFQWTMTPFVKNYDLLIDSLEANGLVRNQDFYVWNYDWRKPLSQIVSNFSDYINSLNLETGEKLDLVGHSLGGLVARIWTQDNYDVVNQTITLGSPHFGAVKAYEAWNGAKISDNLDVASIAINVLLQIQNKNYDTSVQTLRNYAPIVYDLSPTFSFLKRNGNNVTGRFSEYLNQKNDIVAAINDKLITVDGEGVATKEYINLGDRSLFDKVLNIWEDGRPLSYIYGQGDGTVLKKSALISGSENIGFDSEHGALVNKSTNWILTKLGLGITTSSTFNYPQKQVVFYLSSPAVMVVNCGGTERSDIDGWVIMENQESKNCQIKLTGKDGGGTYHLVIGENDKWKYFEGEIANQQILNIVLNDEEIYWQMLKRDFSNLKAVGAIVAVEQKNMVNTIDEYLKFRIKTRKFKYSEEILENMKYILDNKIFSPLEINNMYIKALASKSLVETNLRLLARMGILPKYEAALNYEQANNFMSRGKNYAANYLANKLYGIVWK